MSYFSQHGDAFIPTAGKDTLLDGLPVGNFLVSENPMAGMFFQKVDDFTHPGKLYGDIDTRADRILNTFMDRERATGALFAGEKGSGKSQLARLISIKGYALGIPTILVNAPWQGDAFSNLLAKLQQPAIIQMDEFEKVYSREEQEGVLTLLDGSMTSKKLFILTVNDKYRVDSHMRNRPGRLFYSLDFAGLEHAFVREYCQDNLGNQEHIEQVLRVAAMFDRFNFDMLKALVEEMNRYKEDAFDAMEMLNAKPFNEDTSVKFDVQIWDKDGNRAINDEDLTLDNTPITANRNIMAVYGTFKDESEEDGERDEHIIIKASHVQKMDAEKGVWEFLTDTGFRLIFTRRKEQAWTARDYAAY